MVYKVLSPHFLGGNEEKNENNWTELAGIKFGTGRKRKMQLTLWDAAFNASYLPFWVETSLLRWQVILCSNPGAVGQN